MIIRTIAYLSILFIAPFSLCMESEQSNTNTNDNRQIIQVNNHITRKLRNQSKQNKSHPLLFTQRTRRINLLEDLLNCNIQISFDSQNQPTKFWLDRDKRIVQNILHDQLLLFLSYKIECQKKISITHTPFQNKPLVISLHINNSSLHFTAKQSLDYNTRYKLKKFLHEYIDNAQIQQIISLSAHYQQQPSKDLQLFTQHQNNSNAEDQIRQLPEEEQTLFATLPYNTQQLLIEILFDTNDC